LYGEQNGGQNEHIDIGDRSGEEGAGERTECDGVWEQGAGERTECDGVWEQVARESV